MRMERGGGPQGGGNVTRGELRHRGGGGG